MRHDARTPRAPFRAHRGVAGGCAPLESAPTSLPAAPRGPVPGRTTVSRFRARPPCGPDGAVLRRGGAAKVPTCRTTRGWAPGRSLRSTSRPTCRLFGPAASGRTVPLAVTAASGPQWRTSRCVSTRCRRDPREGRGRSSRSRGHGSVTAAVPRDPPPSPSGAVPPRATRQGVAVPFPPSPITVRVSAGAVQRRSMMHRMSTGSPQVVRR